MAKHIWSIPFWNLKSRETFGIYCDIATEMGYSDRDSIGIALCFLERGNQNSLFPYCLNSRESNKRLLEDKISKLRKTTIDKYTKIYDEWKENVATCAV